MSRRRVRPEELDLWRRVAKTTDPLHPNTPSQTNRVIEDAPSPVAKSKPAPPKKEPIEPFRVGQSVNGTTAPKTATSTFAEDPATSPIKMDRKAHDKLKRGKLSPEARIDLHGMTVDQARPALNAFVMTSFAKDRRLILVITGKGKTVEDYGPIPVRPGVLRRAVPQWLRLAPLAQMVLQVTEAHAKHGGGGAYYVYLRRKR